MIQRTLSETQLNALLVLRDAVVAPLELRRTLADLRSQEQFVRICAWCQKEHEKELDEWMPVKALIGTLTPMIHVMCQACQDDHH